MKKLLIILTALVALTCIPGIVFTVSRNNALRVSDEHITTAQAAEQETILDGVYIGPIDVSGLTEAQARAKVEALVEEMNSQRLTVKIGDSQDTLPMWDAEFAWTNTDAPEKAVQLGKSGNIVERFKQLHTLEEEPYVIPFERSVSEDMIRGFVGQEAVAHNKKAVNVGLVRNDDGTFTITPSEDGIKVEEETSVQNILKYITEDWQGETPQCEMTMTVLKPKGSAEELEKVKDVLGEGSTDFSSSSSSRAKNVINGTNKINGHVIYPGEEFSVLSALVPFNEENGYDPAPSYNSGKTEDSFGGGICQVSTTLYLAVLRSELEVVRRSNHSMSVTYVKPSMDAAIAEGAKDFVFRNNTDAPIYIYANADNRTVTMRIYGEETRDPDRKVTFESEVIKEEEPEGVKLTANIHYGLGHVRVVSGAHKGVEAVLWKIVTENGEEVSREQINESHYQMTQETYEIGVVSGSNEATDAMYRAIQSGSLNQVYRVIDAYGTYDTGYDG